MKAQVDKAAQEADAQPAPSTVNLMSHIYGEDPIVLGEPVRSTYFQGKPVARLLS